ncbi:DHH family phosphoesterase [Paenibacillus roseipurpureus]|uniref:Bifunctional oligoribonuclease/PAP phosphatase NrnA n=1 Tax=Paenibacillus roseopurpureus TaxID=2918901 RepID=A0AA96LV96_9BACL|nr:bifunctional oligoribonuclease/PAP phosphatase NrnA [Paenibacillus sp. MBLB1832]WNR46689.1 bifunctional oligoribonuclease/PAP phosphatase NrnA [Paenibacillus sp. MBLB1832]
MSIGKLHATEYGQQLAAAAAFIEQHDDFLVVSHIQPDGDAASSTYATGWILTQLGKSFTMINEGAMPSKFSFLQGSQQTIDYSEKAPTRQFQTIISVDCADFSRMGRISTLFDEQAQLLNIDHHPTNDCFGSCHLIKHDAAATVQILYDLAILMNLEPDIAFGECIYTGLLTDTGGFRYSNTTSEVMKIGASMLELGVRGAEIAEEVLERMTYSQIVLLQKALSTLSFAYERKLAWLAVSLADLEVIGASSDDLDGLVNYPRNVEGVEVGMLIKEKAPGVIKISLRSSGLVDVAAIAQSLGGGGHVRASGCTILGTLDEAVAKMVQEVGDKLR